MKAEDLQPAAETTEVPAIATELPSSAGDQAAYDLGVEGNFARLNAEPKVKIRIPRQNGDQVVIINGARFNIKCGETVAVPESVANVLAESERI